MLKFLLLIQGFLLTLCSQSLFAQEPQIINFQGIVQNANGSPVADSTPVSIRFIIHRDSASGPVVFQETHNTIVASQGFISVPIGGTFQSGSGTWHMDSIFRSSGNTHLEVGLDVSQSGTFTPMGTTPIMSVPYAMQAGNSYWDKIGSNIVHNNNGNVLIGQRNQNTNAKLGVSLSSTDNLSGIQISDTSTTVNRNALIVSHFGTPNTSAAYISSNEIGLTLIGKPGLFSVGGNKESAYFINNSDTFPTIYAKNNGNHAAGVFNNTSDSFPTVSITNYSASGKALNIPNGKVAIGNTSKNSSGKLSILNDLPNENAVTIVDTNVNAASFYGLKCDFKRANSGTAINIVSNQTGLAIDSKYGIYSYSMNGWSGSFLNTSNTYPAVFIQNLNVGGVALEIPQGSLQIGSSLAKEKLSIDGNIKIYSNTNNNAAPAGGAGTIRFNADSNQFQGWNGSAWTNFGAGSASTGISAVVHDGTLQGTGTSGNPLKLFNGSNINDYMKWNGTTWVSAALPAAPSPQTLSTLCNGGSISISGGNTINLPWSDCGTGLSYNGNTNVGIGWSSPVQKLDVNGGIRIGNTALNSGGSIRYTGTDFEGYDGTSWKSFTSTSGSLNGDVTGSAGSNTVTKIQNRNVANTTPTNGQVLTWNNAQTRWEPTTPSGGSGVWNASGNDIYNTNTGKVLIGLTTPSGNGEIQVKGNAGAFGVGTKIWSTNSYVNALLVIDSASSGGPVGCAACTGNNALKAVTQFGTAVFATSNSGDGVFAHSTSGNALKIDGFVRDMNNHFVMNTGAVSTAANTYDIPTSFSNVSSDIIMITPVGGSNTTNKTYMLKYNSGTSKWQITTKDASNFEANLSFNLMLVKN